MAEIPYVERVAVFKVNESLVRVEFGAGVDDLVVEGAVDKEV